MSSKSSSKKYKVYKHTAPNGKVYIGITHQNVLSRWAGGFGYQTQIYFWRAIVKYGWINIKHDILYENLSEEEAKAKEIELIKEYKSHDYNYGYNIDLGYDHLASEESRRKSAETRKGKRWSERQRLGYLEYVEHHVGRTVYKYTKDGKLLDSFKNVTLAAKDAGIPTETMRTYLHNDKMPRTLSAVYSYKDFHKPEYYKGNYQTAPVDMYDLAMNYIQTFNSIAEAGRFLGSSGTKHITDVCKGKRLSSNGYIWRYHNENSNNKSA